jgi:hypothetical protein
VPPSCIHRLPHPMRHLETSMRRCRNNVYGAYLVEQVSPVDITQREPGIHIQSHRGQHSTDLKSSKFDNPFEHEVSKNEGAALARRLGCGFIETSAKTAQNAERVFTKLNLVCALRTREIPRTTDSEKEEVPHLASS